MSTEELVRNEQLFLFLDLNLFQALLTPLYANGFEVGGTGLENNIIKLKIIQGYLALNKK